VGQFVWASDGKSIIFTSDREGLDGRRVWKVSVKGGPIEPEDDALLAKIYPRQTPRSALSRDRHRLAYVGLKVENSSVWRVRLAKPGGKVLTQARILQSADQLAAPGLSPDGTHVSFTSTRSGAENVWTCDVTGHGTLQLTSFSGELVGAPRWSPDGNWLVFDGRAENHAQIFMIDSEGHNMHALTTGEHENGVPIWSRNGKAIYFVSNRSGKHELWKQDIATALSTQITQHGGGAGAESYDGRYLYYTKHQSSGIWRMPIDGGEEERIMDMPEPWYSGYWDVSESGLYFYDVAATPRPAIKYYDFQTRQITTVLEPDEQGMEFWPALSASRDGRTLLYGTVSWNSTLMIADEIR